MSELCLYVEALTTAHDVAKFEIRIPLLLRLKEIIRGDFPGGPVVKTPRFQCKGHGFNPLSGN